MSILGWFSPPQSEGTRKLAVIGGRLEDGNAAIYGEMHRLAAGRILVFPTASSEPEAVGPETVQVFRAYGFEAELSPVHGAGAVAAANDPATVELVRQYGSVYFTGGNQAHIINALAPGGVETPVLAAIRAVNEAGGLVAGSSAGAAMMSSDMIVGGTSLDATVFGVTDDPEQPGMLIGKGLGFFNWGIVDQHFIKRGRLGRLIVAMAATGVQRGFGIDENTALFVDGKRARVIGEYGAFYVDMTGAVSDGRGRTFENVRISYLDDGDAFDLSRFRVVPGPHKRRVRLSEIAYRAPARSQRNVFGAYTLYDLLARLVLGDPLTYTTDRATAVEPKTGMAVTVELERLRGVSRTLIAIQESGLRMTAVNFRATVMSERLSAARLANRATKLSRDYGVKPGPQSRLMLLGSSPLQGDPSLMAEIVRHAQGPVGVIASASAEPHNTAKSHIAALREHGIEGIDFGITIDNVERISRDKEVVEQIAALKTILIPGGNQIRLVETLLHRGEETAVLLAIARAHAAGATVIAASGAASALSGFMIAGGSSYEAFRYGVSSDTGHGGLVIQEGVGLFGAGIIDQNLFSSRRLGRLIVACAEEGVRYGFGICEDTLLIATGDNAPIEVAGRHGVVLIEIDHANLVLQSDSFVARGIKLSFARPGDRIDIATGTVQRSSPPEAASAALERLINELAAECGALRGLDGSTDHLRNRAIVMGFVASGDGTALLDVESARDDRS